MRHCLGGSRFESRRLSLSGVPTRETGSAAPRRRCQVEMQTDTYRTVFLFYFVTHGECQTSRSPDTQPNGGDEATLSARSVF